MNAAAATQKDRMDPERLAEAGVWIARLQSHEGRRETEAGLRRWLLADPLNARAFELVSDVWEDSANLRRLIPLALAAPRQSRYQRALAASIAAAAVVAAVAIVFLLRAGSVVTDVGEQRLLTLEDGSRIFLNTATHVVVRYDEHARRVEIKSGEALFNVAKRADWPFIVAAGDRQVRALGTSFVVRRDGARLAVTLVSGKVAVSSIDAEEGPDLLASPGASSIDAEPRPRQHASTPQRPGVFTLTPGQRVTFAAGASARIDMPSLEDATAWRRGQVVLDDTELSAAVAEMNRYSEVKLVIEHREARTLLISGLFQAGDSRSFASAVALSYGLDVIEKNDTIILSGIPASPRR